MEPKIVAKYSNFSPETILKENRSKKKLASLHQTKTNLG